MKFLPVYACAIVALVSCSTIQPGNDPVVVDAERTTQVAMTTFDSFLKYERSNDASLREVNPAIHKYANKVRDNGQQWLRTARSMTQAYKYNRSSENKANLLTAIAVLQEAVNQINQFMK